MVYKPYANAFKLLFSSLVMESKDIADLRKAGKIASEAKEFAKKFIKKNLLLIEVAEKIELKIEELGGKPAFPVNLSINHVAAHYTPGFDDANSAYGLLKVDIGVQINGWIADTAFSIDLEKNEINKKIIETAEKALENAINFIRKDTTLGSIGKSIQESIEQYKLQPVKNLSGHQISQWKVHAGITVPNVDNKSPIKLSEGIYAIEPFVTNGNGGVYDGKPSGIYRLQEKKPVRDAFARRVFQFIQDEYKTLPFCQRWLVKKFGARTLLTLHFLEQQGILYQYPQLIEKAHGIVGQAEHTILIHDGKTEVITA